METSNKAFNQTIETEKANNIFKDYSQKIIKHLYKPSNIEIYSEDINSLIILLNWCFYEKNDFFLKNFNKKILPIYETYNQLKSNILSNDYNVMVFDKISVPKLKILKFILFNYTLNFDEINNNENNKILCEKVSKNSIRNCINFVSTFTQNS